MITLFAVAVVILITSPILVWQYFIVRSLKAQNLDLRNRYQINPSYDCQMFMADVMGGKGMFKIESVDRENLFLLRR